MDNYNVIIKNNNEENKYTVSVHNDIEKKVLKYTESNGTVTTFDYKRNILIRDNNEMRLELIFILGKPTKSKMFIKELNKDLEIDVLTKELNIKDDVIKVVYEINDVSFEYILEKE